MFWLSSPPALPALGHELFGSELRVELLGPNGAARDPPATQGTSGLVAGRLRCKPLQNVLLIPPLARLRFFQNSQLVKKFADNVGRLFLASFPVNLLG